MQTIPIPKFAVILGYIYQISLRYSALKRQETSQANSLIRLTLVPGVGRLDEVG